MGDCPCSQWPGPSGHAAGDLGDPQKAGSGEQDFSSFSAEKDARQRKEKGRARELG